MLKHFQIGVAKEIKADGTPITIADTTINTMVIDAVATTYPQDGVLGEEASSMKEHPEYLWVCDPLDGTIPYVFGIPISMFSLALVKDGEPVLGVLYDPYMKRLYHAIKGEGAYLNEQKLHVNDEKTLTKNFIAVPSKSRNLFDVGGLLQETVKRDINTCVFRCFTAEAILIATGQFVGNIFGHQTAHDVAAIKVIVEEAGGKVTDLMGNDQRYDRPTRGAIISNGLLHNELVALVKPYLTLIS